MRSIRRTQYGERILKLKGDKERKGAAYKSLAEEVLGEGVEMRALTVEATLMVKSLEEITEAEEIITAMQPPQPFCYRRAR